MVQFEKIIVPVDFHQHSDDLARFAVTVANKLGGRLMFVHVLDHFARAVAYAEDSPDVVKAAVEELQARAQARMTELIAASGPACPGCEGAVLKGEVVDCIVDYVREYGIDLIIMGTHGAQGIEKVMLGSVVERVIKRASCPILLYNPYRGDSGYTIKGRISEVVQPV